MTEQVHYRIEKNLVKRTKRICASLGITPTQAVSMFFAQMVRTRGLPFRPGSGPESDADLVDAKRRNTLLLSLDDAEGW
jgi:addiction module RelB/DinJ family antitoxin